MDAGCVELGVYALVYVESFGTSVDAREVCLIVLECVIWLMFLVRQVRGSLRSIYLFILSHYSTLSSFIIVNVDYFFLCKEISFEM